MCIKRPHRTVHMASALFVATTLALFLPGCGGQGEAPEKTTAVTDEDVKKETTEALQTTQTFLAQQKEEYEKQMGAKLDEFEGRIEDLRAKAEAETAEAKTELKEALEELNRKQEAAEKELDKLEAAAIEGWEKMKEGTDSAIEELEKAYERVVARFQ